MAAIGIRLGTVRRELDITQRDLAVQIGLDVGTASMISKWEHGKVKRPGLHLQLAMFNFVHDQGYDLAWLITGQGRPRRPEAWKDPELIDEISRRGLSERLERRIREFMDRLREDLLP